jgi:MFS transporter, SHS family, sialic acid transporter
VHERGISGRKQGVSILAKRIREKHGRRLSVVSFLVRMNNRQRPGLTLLAAFLGWMFDGMEMGIFPLVAGPALNEMGINHGLLKGSAELGHYVKEWMGWVTALFLFGAAAGGLVFGWLGDRVGRVKAMTWSIIIYSGFTGLCYFAAEPWQLAGLRFIAALGMGGEWSLGVALVMECWPENRRPLLAGAIGAAANVGYVVIALIALNFPITDTSWRWVMLVGATPAALTFLIRLFIPESEKWTESQKAARVSPLAEILGPALRWRTLLAIAFASIALLVTWGTVQWIPLWASEMLREAGKKDDFLKAKIQLASALGATLGSLVAPLVGGIFGRRITYFFLCVTSLAACQWLFRGFTHFDGTFLAVTGVVGFFTAAFYGWLPLYLPELFPTRVRATGQGIAFNAGRIFAGIGVLQMASLMQFLGGSAQAYAPAGATISLIYVLGMALIWLAPETKGRPLPE